MGYKFLAVLLFAAFSNVAISKNLTPLGDWVYQSDFGLGATNKGAFAATVDNNVTFVFQCGRSSSDLFFYVKFKGNVEGYKNSTFVVAFDGINSTLVGFASQQNLDYVSIQTTSIGSDAINDVFNIVKNAAAPVGLVIEQLEKTDQGYKKVDEFRYRLSSTGSTAALNKIQTECRQTAFTGVTVE
jgi:hypothetical protein